MFRLGARPERSVIVVIRIHEPGEAKLFGIIETMNALSAEFGFCERGQEHAREDGDDRDDDQQFDECECVPRFAWHFETGSTTRNSIVPSRLASWGTRELMAVGGFAEVVPENETEAVTAFVGMAARVEDIGVSDGEARGAKPEGAKEAFLYIHAPAVQPT